MNHPIAPGHRIAGLRTAIASVLVLTASFALPSADGEAPASVLDQHLAQVPPAAMPGTSPVTAETATEIARILQKHAAVAVTDWKANRGRAQLLAGLSADLQAVARKLATDEKSLKNALAEHPSLPLVLALVAERNPAAQAAYQNWRAECARYSQADYLQDLLRQYRGFVREIDTAVGSQPLMMDEGGLFVGSDVLSLKGQLIDQSVEIARLNYLSVLRRALREAATNYIEMQYFTRAVEILRDNHELAEQMNESAQAQLAAGQVTQADVLKTRAMLEMLDNRIAQENDNRLPQRRAALNGLLNLPPDTLWGTVAPVDLASTPPSAAEVASQYLANNQDLLRARWEAVRMATMLRMAELMVAPAAGVGAARLDLNRGADAGPTRKEMAVFPTMPATQPPPASFSANLGYLEELRISVQRMNLAAQAQASQGAANARIRLHAAAIAARTIQALEVTVPQRKQAFDLLKVSYAAGRVPLVEYLDAGRDYFEDLLQQAEAQMEFGRSWAELEDMLGRSLATQVLSSHAQPAETFPPSAASMPASVD